MELRSISVGEWEGVLGSVHRLERLEGTRRLGWNIASHVGTLVKNQAADVAATQSLATSR